MKIAAFDIETEGLVGKFLSGAVVSDIGTVYTTDLAGLIDVMRVHAELGYTFFAHNAEYDVAASLWQAKERVVAHFYEANFNRATWHYAGDKRVCEIWDTMNLDASVGLAALGSAIGLSKLETPQVLKGLTPDRYLWKCDKHQNWECIECYNVRDAEIVYRFATQFYAWMDYQGLSLKRTLGGNAVAIWQSWDARKAQSLKAPLIKDMARLAYHGARCEVFKPGIHQTIFTADIRAHYSAVMAECPMPDMRGLRYVENPRPMSLEGLHGVVEATVEIPAMYVPPLPAKMPDKLLYYPIGIVRGHWVIAELLYALSLGVRVISIHRIAYTNRYVYPFENFAKGLWLLRQEAEKAGDGRAYIYKTMANALPGRLGMRDEQTYRSYESNQGFLSNADIAGKDVRYIGDTRIVVDERQIRMLSKVNNVMWAATINAYGRIRLHKHLQAAGSSLVYCDTDSVMSMTGIATEGDGFGQLHDTGVYDRGQFFGPKLYRLESGMDIHAAVAKGIPKQLAWQFMENGKVSFPAPAGIVMGVRNHVSPTHWQTLTRSNRGTFTGRTVLRPRRLIEAQGWSDTVPVSAWLEPVPDALSRSPERVSR